MGSTAFQSGAAAKGEDRAKRTKKWTKRDMGEKRNADDRMFFMIGLPSVLHNGHVFTTTAHQSET
jgi:hypothetical protein